MKRVVLLVLAVITVLSAFPGTIGVSGAVKFKDVPENAWYYEHVQFVANHPKELMVGYAGNFGPLDYLTVEQFIKIAVAAAGRSVVVPEGTYWGDVYVPIGLDLGIVQPGEFTDYKRPITRAEMARIIIRALPYITGEKDILYVESDIRTRVLDYNNIPVDLRPYVCQAYQLGILVGGTDGRFQPNDGLTRASAAAVVHKMLDPTERTVYVTELTQFWSDEEFEEYVRKNAEEFFCIAKIEGRKIYWKSAYNPTPTLLNETGAPGINDILYDYVKHMLYYAIKNGVDFWVSYNGDKLTISYDIRQMNTWYGDIDLTIYSEPTYNYYAEEYAPGKQKTPSKYRWHLTTLRDDGYLTRQGWQPGNDRTKIKWTQEKHTEVFRQACIDLYGPVQGNLFYEFIFPKYYELFLHETWEDSYFGLVPGTDIEVAYYYSDENRVKHTQFWTTAPGVRK